MYVYVQVVGVSVHVSGESNTNHYSKGVKGG